MTMRTVLRGVMALLAAVVVLLSASGAHAQQLCALRDAAITQLEAKFNERVVGRGLAKRGKEMVELLVSESGSWTVVISDTQGRTCIVASGDSWMPVPLLVGEPA